MYKLDENGNPILDKDGNKILLDKVDKDDNNEALKRQVTDLTNEVTSLKSTLEFQKSENAKIEAHKDDVLREKREEVEKRKALESLHEGLSEEEVFTALKRAKDGDEAVEQQVRDIVKSRMKELEEEKVQPLKAEVQELRVSSEGLRGKLSKSLVRQELIKRAEEFGVKTDMYDYVMFKLSDRIAVNQAGDKVYKNEDGHEVDSINWEHVFIKLKEKNPTIFDKNKGSNAKHSLNAEGVEIKDNPYSKENFSLSKQFQLEKDNPELAKKLKLQA